MNDDESDNQDDQKTRPAERKLLTLDELELNAKEMDAEELSRAGIAPDPASAEGDPIPDTTARAVNEAFKDLDDKQTASVMGAQRKIETIAWIAASFRTDLIEEMIQIGTITACKAFDRYDAKRSKFTTYISSRVMWAMLDFRRSVMTYEQRFGAYAPRADQDRSSEDRISISFLISNEGELVIDRPVCPQAITDRRGEVEEVMHFLVQDAESNGAKIAFYALEHLCTPTEAGRALGLSEEDVATAIRSLRNRYEAYSARSRTAHERSLIGRNRAAIIDRWKKVIL